MNYYEGLRLEERVASLSQLDPLIPIEFFEIFKKKSQLEPERLLMLAVLEDAVACLVKYASASSGRSKRLLDETRAWILLEDEDWLFSFNNVCSALAMDPVYVRRGLVQLAESERAKANQSSMARTPPASPRRVPRERSVPAAA
jgi:hypothetical protein